MLAWAGSGQRPCRLRRGRRLLFAQAQFFQLRQLVFLTYAVMGLHLSNHGIHLRCIQKTPGRLRVRILAKRLSFQAEKTSDLIFLPALTMDTGSLVWRPGQNTPTVHADGHDFGNGNRWLFPTMVDVVFGCLIALARQLTTDSFCQAIHMAAANQQIAQDAQ